MIMKSAAGRLYQANHRVASSPVKKALAETGCRTGHPSAGCKGFAPLHRQPYLPCSHHIMDPISIITASATLVRLCATTSGYIFTFVTNARNVDTAITTLGVEIHSLSQVLGSINDSFNDSSLASSALSSQTGHEAQHWRNVQRSMDDCKNTLENLVRVLENVRRGSGSFLARARSQVSFGMSSAEITSLKQQIAAYRQTMQLSLQLITVYAAGWIMLIVKVFCALRKRRNPRKSNIGVRWVANRSPATHQTIPRT
jgi:hypothetical protein